MMKRTKSQAGEYAGSGKKTGEFAALLLFGIFAVSILTVLLFGAKVYRSLTERDSSVYDNRTAVSYLTMKVRQSDVQGSIEIRKAEGTDILVLREELDGIGYETLIYCYDGYLCELFTVSLQQEAGAEADTELLAGGNRLLEASGFAADMKQDHLRLVYTDAAGTQQELKLTLRSGKEVAS